MDRAPSNLPKEAAMSGAMIAGCRVAEITGAADNAGASPKTACLTAHLCLSTQPIKQIRAFESFVPSMITPNRRRMTHSFIAQRSSSCCSPLLSACDLAASSGPFPVPHRDAGVIRSGIPLKPVCLPETQWEVTGESPEVPGASWSAWHPRSVAIRQILIPDR